MIRLRVPTGPPAKGTEVKAVQHDPQRAASGARLFGNDEEEGEAMFEILYMNWRVMEWGKLVQAYQNRCLFVDQVQVYWILEGDPRYAFVPASSNEEIKVTLVSSLPRQ